MSILSDTYCQICGRFITKERWDKHLYSSRHLHREVNGYWPAFFPQRKLTRDEGNILEMAFWKMFFNTRNKELDDFLIIYFTMTSNLKNHTSDIEEFRNEFRNIMEGQFENDLYNKSFISYDRGTRSVSLEDVICAWKKIINNHGPIPNKVCDYTETETAHLLRSAIDSERKNELFIQILRDRDIIV